MSEVQKPVEETPAAAPAAAAAAEAAPATEAPAATEPAATEAPAAEVPKDAAAENTEAAPAAAAEDKKEDVPAEQPKEEAKKEEVTPASEGVLGHKAPGLVKGLRFSKRFFYFSEEAVEAKNLSVFHQNEKPAVANPIAAWASQTGKGLLFFTKRAEDKPIPAGIFNLADVSDVTKEGSNEFLFKVNGHKHTFQASSATERDSWIAALEAKTAEAKAEKETITSSEGYKAELEKLTKPAAAAAAAKPAEKPADKPAEAKEEGKKEEAAPAEENKDKTTAKSRSQSRKRTSLFGTLLGKKEEAEEKKEEKKEEKAEEAKPAEASTEAPAEAAAPAAEGSEAAPAAPATETEATPAAPAEAAEKKDDKEEKEEKKEDKKEEKKAEKSKRTSLFGNFFQKVTSPSHEKSEKEATSPAETAVASTAPQLDNPVEEAAVKPIEPESVTAPAEGEAAKETATAQSPAAETPKDKRRTSFFGNFGKKKGDSDNEGTDGESKPKGNKLGGLFRKPSKAVKSETPKEATATETETKPETAAPKQETVEESPAEESAKPAEAPATEESKPVNVSSTTAPVQAAA